MVTRWVNRIVYALVAGWLGYVLATWLLVGHPGC